MATTSAKKLLRHSLTTDNAELTALLILAGGLECLHMMQAHQPASVGERAKKLIASMTPPTELAPLPLAR